MARLRSWITIAAFSAAGVLAGCGGGDGSASLPPAPEDCVEGWNESTEGLKFGRHAYNEHGSRQAEVAKHEPGRAAINIKQDMACAVIFAVPETDEEYGDVGLAKTKFGWASMQELDRSDQRRLRELQARASEQPNVIVFPDGTIGQG